MIEVPAGSVDRMGQRGEGRPSPGSGRDALRRCLRAARRTLGHYRRDARDRIGRAVRRLGVSAAPAICVSRLDPHNIGDMRCSPRPYFGFLDRFLRLDILEFQDMDVGLDGKVVVVGGGGLFANDFWARGLERMADSRGATLICWGAGHNAHGSERIDRIDLLDRFDLVGLRDYGQGFEWVPCASCMDPAFDRDYRVEHDLVIYDHGHFPVGEEAPSIPRMSNSCEDFDAVIRFLGSAATVVTSTYHGAYWATLLGRRVIVVDPFSSKFFGLKHAPVITTSEGWRNTLGRTRSYPAALEECRSANRSFAEKALEVIEGHRRARRRRAVTRPE